MNKWLYIKRFTSQNGSYVIPRDSRSRNCKVSTLPGWLLAHLRLLRGVKPMPGSCVASFFHYLDGPQDKPELGFSNWSASLSLSQVQHQTEQQVLRHISGALSIHSQLENQTCSQNLSVLDKPGIETASGQASGICSGKAERKTVTPKTNRLVLERGVFSQSGRTNLGAPTDFGLPSVP